LHWVAEILHAKSRDTGAVKCNCFPVRCIGISFSHNTYALQTTDDADDSCRRQTDNTSYPRST